MRCDSGSDDTGRGTQRVRDVVFVQGGGEGTHDSWDDKLVASLEDALGAGYRVRYPRMPDEANPEPGPWKRLIVRELAKSTEGAIVVAHSVGAAIVLDLLTDSDSRKRRPRLAGVFLVATPFIGDGGWPIDDLRATKAVARAFPAETPLYLYQGSKDDTVPLAHADLFEAAFPHAIIRRLEGRDHQLSNNLSEVAYDIRRLVAGGAEI